MKITFFAALACTLATAVPAPAAGCFTFTDPAGDTEIATVGIADAEPDLDIVGAQYLTTPTSIGARVEVAALGLTPAKAPGDVFQVGFTHAGFYFDIYAERLAGTVVLGRSSPDGLTVTGTVDAATNSVTVTVPMAEIAAATGVPLANAILGDLNVGASADYGTWVLYDDASGTATYRVGSTC
jgi:hypothetical protein